MHIEIIKTKTTKEGILVEFNTAFGSGKALWGGRIPEHFAATYYVELGFEDIFRWNVNVECVDDNSYFIKFMQNTFTIQGKVDTLWEDDIISITLDNKVHVMIYAPGFPGEIGDFVKLSTRQKVYIYDTNI